MRDEIDEGNFDEETAAGGSNELYTKTWRGSDLSDTSLFE
jgi:hypothetical protein